MSKQTAKHVPQRTCVACRETSAKREFVRIVRSPAGRVEVDEAGKAAGRGAYLCARAACWQSALKKDTLSRALRTTVSSEDREALRAYAERFEPAPVGA
jgi:predicted RNA-binding protein YlxR (DUF448 family)